MIRPLGRQRVVIVVPCYNESNRLPVTLFEDFLADPQCGCVFVDDGSTDGTLNVLDSIRAGREEHVSVVRCPSNRGKAEAVRYGIQHALEKDADFYGFWDADLATPLGAVWDFCSVLEREPAVDMVFGSRVRLLGRHIERRALRHYAGRAFATVVSWVLRLPVYDTQCGAKIFRSRDLVGKLFERPFLSRWVFDVELIARYIQVTGSPQIAAKGIYECPLHEWTDVAGSRLKLSDFGVAFWDIVRIYRKYMRAAVTTKGT